MSMKRKPMSSMNVIPFIDIMLVLLVMVLTTATFIRQGIIPIDLPDAKSSDKKSDNKEVTIYVTKNGELFYDKEKDYYYNILLKVSKNYTIKKM